MTDRQSEIARSLRLLGLDQLILKQEDRKRAEELRDDPDSEDNERFASWFGGQLLALNDAILAALQPSPSPAPAAPVAIVPPHCTGASIAFDPGVMHVSKDGSGYIAVSEEHFSLEDDRCEGPDGPEGSVHWITRMDASEVAALRDFLTGGAPAPETEHGGGLVEALVKALEPFALDYEEAWSATVNGGHHFKDHVMIEEGSTALTVGDLRSAHAAITAYREGTAK